MGIGFHTWPPGAVEKATDLAERLLTAGDADFKEVRRRLLKLAGTFALKGDDAAAFGDTVLKSTRAHERISERMSKVAAHSPRSSGVPDAINPAEVTGSIEAATAKDRLPIARRPRTPARQTVSQIKPLTLADTSKLVNLGIRLTHLSPPDLAGARTAYEQAAAAGNTDAHFNLGYLLAKELEVPDLIGARAAYEQAAAGGNTGAMVNLGTLLVNLNPPDLTGARTAYEQGAAAGDIRAMVSLGSLLATHLVPPDLAGARRWFELAAAAGHAGAMASLGQLLGNLNPPDLAGARTAYEQASAAGSTVAMINLGTLLAELDPPDLTGASTAYAQAVAAGDMRALNYIGNLLAKLQKPPDLAGARTAYEQAAAGGDTSSMTRLGRLLAELDPPDLIGARRWFEQAVAAGDSGAAVELRKMLDTPQPQAPAIAEPFEQSGVDAVSNLITIPLGGIEYGLYWAISRALDNWVFQGRYPESYELPVAVALIVCVAVIMYGDFAGSRTPRRTSETTSQRAARVERGSAMAGKAAFASVVTIITALLAGIITAL